MNFSMRNQLMHRKTIPSSVHTRAMMAMGLSAVLVCVGLAAPSLAASSDSFSLRISEKQGALLTNADSMMSAMSRDLGFDRMIARNRPYLELTNNSTSKDSLSEFQLALGDPRFNFNCSALGACAVVASSTKSVQLVSSQEDGGNTLDVKLPSGLAPGATVRFQIALGMDTTYKTDKDYFATPDFRTVLFHMDGGQFYPDHAPSGTVDSTVTVNFGTLVAGPVSLSSFDQQVDPNSGKYYNKIYHAYGATDPVQAFSGLSGSTSVPEPATASLAAIGICCGLLATSKRLRRG
jgi:hypothetical protein